MRIKNRINTYVLLFCWYCIFSLPVFALDIDTQIDAFFTPLSDVISKIIFFAIPFFGVDVPIIVVWLLFGAFVFTLYFEFINIRGFKYAIKILKGDYDDSDGEGEISHFQALVTALSGTIGLGNIAGVAIALSIGGPGATLWMILGGFLGMSSKFLECTLGAKYRKFDKDGRAYGGPMYYLNKGFADKGFKKIGKIAGGFFAVSCVLATIGTGNMFQINQAAQQFVYITGGQASIFNDREWLFGLILAVLIGFIIIGGIKKITKVTEKLVPFMCIMYVLAALTIIVIHYQQLPSAIILIIKGAFAPTAVAGGVIGVMLQGFKRSTFSNEAGVGTASIAYAATKSKNPIKEGLVSMLGPFIDTIVICTMTALVIIVTGAYMGSESVQGIELTSLAFKSTISWFPYVLAFAVILFAVSTAISWSYYGIQAWCYLFGESTAIKRVYQLIFCAFIVVGASTNIMSIVNFADAMMFAMAFPNVIGMLIFAPIIKADLEAFMVKIK